MKLLVVGGSGLVGGLVLPHIAQRHTLRILDRQPPADSSWEYVQGDLTDLDALRGAVQDMDALLFMAMGAKEYKLPAAIVTNFDVNVKGVYLALQAAHDAGIEHAVYTSSMSVYGGDLLQRTFPDEGLTPDSTHLYGLTKRFGEEVCENATRAWGMSVNALRLCFPTADEQWRAQTDPNTPTLATAASDVANALLAALELRSGFQAFTISGDYNQRIMNMSKARRMLGWQPLQRPGENSDASA